MRRIDTVNREVDKFGPGKDGFRAARPGVSQPTYLSAEFFDAIQESLVRVIERAGLIPSGDHDQVVDAIDSMVESVRTGLASPSGSAQVAYIAAGVGARLMWVQDKLREFRSVADYHLAVDGEDYTRSVQKTANAGSFSFKAGKTYHLYGDIFIPENTKIIVEVGATVINHGGRFVSWDVNNVFWRIDGEVSSKDMRTAPAKPGAPNLTDGTGVGDERGFIEFGGSSLTSASVSGFTVCGFGTISGSWTGVPNFDDPVYQVNRKGIASWNSKNVLVTGVRVRGFDGEAVYWFGNTTDCESIRFDDVSVDYTRFNALNFNSTGAWKGILMTRCRVNVAFAGIEASVGDLLSNFIRNTTNKGIWQGLGGGHGPQHIKNNTVDSCDGQSFVCTFAASGLFDFLLKDNIAIASGSDSFVIHNVTNFDLVSNNSRGHARLYPGFAFRTTSSCRSGRVGNNVCIDPGPHSLANYSLEGIDMDLSPNHTILTTGAVTRYIGDDANFFGGRYAFSTKPGERENQIVVQSSDFGRAGTGPGIAFRNGSGGKTTFASIDGLGNEYDAAGSTGGLSINTGKASTGSDLEETARFDSARNTTLANNLTIRGAYENTTANSSNVVIAPGGLIQRSVSSERFKAGIEPIEPAYFNAILEMFPFYYHSTCEGDNPLWSYWGLSAEKMAEIDPRLVFWRHQGTKQILIRHATPPIPAVCDAMGKILQPAIPAYEDVYEVVADIDSPLVPDGVQYERLSVLLLAKMQEMEPRLQRLEAALARL